ncbi:urea ABC transporter ATP-binding subunit UrtE [Azospirillum sp. A29]|uniref:urea ABC transporter ATP-binding subunit UrtE n=1 Tax=unclassified Azospirillum TaxID=2630922 RepID=UPI00366B4E6B
MTLTVDTLNQHYGSSHILRNISFAMEERQCLAVLGRNGAGKTTLLRCLMGLLPASSGSVRYGAADLTGLPPHRRIRAGFGYVPQGREIFANLTVRQNIEIASRACAIPDADAVFDELVALFPVLGEMWNRRGGDLSGGQQQQLSIARALATRPSLLILDEPTEGIQPSVVQRIEEVIASLKERIAILLVEQYLDFARSISDRYVVLSRGGVIESGESSAMDHERIKSFVSV